jgi:hypothetical protein
MFIPDLGSQIRIFSIPDLGSRVKKGTKQRFSLKNARFYVAYIGYIQACYVKKLGIENLMFENLLN